ncbi:hypothetical protein FRC10_002093 [Ceratobasidium sp. 414]|nr:hypothetical protein FRC10_002093 [Ceratobasidium sp. 414]
MQYRIYNVDFQMYAKRGHPNEDSVETGQRDGNDNNNDDYDWWIIKPVPSKENCFTIAHLTEKKYWGLGDERDRTPTDATKMLRIPDILRPDE